MRVPSAAVATGFREGETREMERAGAGSAGGVVAVRRTGGRAGEERRAGQDDPRGQVGHGDQLPRVPGWRARPRARLGPWRWAVARRDAGHGPLRPEELLARGSDEPATARRDLLGTLEAAR